MILCKSVLGSLGSYLFSLYKAPKNVLKILEGIRSRFFWGGSNERRKITWIGWKKVLNDNEHGGLKIGSLKAINVGLMGKWWWRLKTESDALWRKTIVAIHGSDGNLGGPSRHGCWGTICKLNVMTDVGIFDLRSLFFEDEDGWNWGLEDDGRFTVSSLRRLVNDHYLERNGT